jgi:protein involved in polysaccharide export with SLBB domain
MWKPAVVFVLLLTMLNVSGGSARAMSGQDAPYRLGAGDEVRIKMFDWRSAVGEIHEWTALNATFSVGPDGNLSLPLIGFVHASGDTLEELENAIAQRLQQTVGLTARPQASVEVTKYRPFYILGSVTRPGAYPYAPGMTILRAVSIAGGMSRITDPSLLTFQRGRLSTAGELRALMLEHAGLLARRARLEAELSGASEVTFPPEIMQREKEKNPTIIRLLQRERTIFTARRAALQSQTEAQQHLKELLNQEVGWLKLKAQKMDEELNLLKQEVANSMSLVSKGLAVSPREVSARQIELEAEGRRLDLDTALLRAGQEIGRADQAIAELRDKLRTEVSTELSQVEEKLASTAVRIKTNSAILAEDGTDADVMAVLAEQTGKPSYTITRRHDADMQQIAAEAFTEVEPGDTIEVKRTGTLPEMAFTNPETVLQLVDPDLGTPGPQPPTAVTTKARSAN